MICASPISRSRAHPTSGRNQRGFTLIELSVALVIALFLMGGMLTMVQSTRKTYGNQNALAQLQDNERLAMTILTDVIQQAGYYTAPNKYAVGTALPADPAFTSAGQGVLGIYSNTVPNDSISIRYFAGKDDEMLLCDGSPSTTVADTGYVNTFSVDKNNSQLLCSVNGAAPVPLVNGVTNLSIYYGVKTNGGSDNSVDTYERADQVLDWTTVSSVQVTITFANPLAGQPKQPATIDFQRVIGIMSRAGITS